MANYNNSTFIRDAIESVLKQTFTEWELLIVDDASIDNSLELIESYLKDRRIKLIKYEKNQGKSAALKNAIELSSSDLFGILDADDALHKDAVKLMLIAHQNCHDCGLIYSTFFECDEKLKISNIAKSPGKLRANKTYLHELEDKVSHFMTFKRSAYENTVGFDLDQKRAIDKDIIYKLEEVTNLKFIDKPLYYYRKHDKGISQAKQANSALYYDILARCKAYRRRIAIGIPDSSKKIIAAALFYNAGYYNIQKNRKTQANWLLVRAIELNPLKWSYIHFYIRRNQDRLVNRLLVRAIELNPLKLFRIKSSDDS